MDASELRAVQAPLKDRYRADPTSAMITLHAEGRLGDELVSCSVDTGRQLVAAGLHPASGGDGTMACSGDMLLEALVSCGFRIGAPTLFMASRVFGRPELYLPSGPILY